MYWFSLTWARAHIAPAMVVESVNFLLVAITIINAIVVVVLIIVEYFVYEYSSIYHCTHISTCKDWWYKMNVQKGTQTMSNKKPHIHKHILLDVSSFAMCVCVYFSITYTKWYGYNNSGFCVLIKKKKKKKKMRVIGSTICSRIIVVGLYYTFISVYVCGVEIFIWFFLGLNCYNKNDFSSLMNIIYYLFVHTYV